LLLGCSSGLVARPMTPLILKRAPVGDNQDDLTEERYCQTGRRVAPRGKPRGLRPPAAEKGQTSRLEVPPKYYGPCMVPMPSETRRLRPIKSPIAPEGRPWMWAKRPQVPTASSAPRTATLKHARLRWQRSPRAGGGNRLRLAHSRFSRAEQPNKLHPFIWRRTTKRAAFGRETVIGQGIRQRPQNQSALSFIDYDVIFAASRHVRYALALEVERAP
jgi:hypothetical protein